MDDKDLKALKDIPVPSASDGARARALQASISAFEEAGEKLHTQTQGITERPRLTTTFTQTLWEWIMERRMLMGTVAASLLAVPIATHVIWNNTNPNLPGFTKTEQLSVGRTDEEKQIALRNEEPATVETFADTDQQSNDQVAEAPPPKPKAKSDNKVAVQQMPENEPVVSLDVAPEPQSMPSVVGKYQSSGTLKNLRTGPSVSDREADQVSRIVTAARKVARERRLQAQNRPATQRPRIQSFHSGEGTSQVLSIAPPPPPEKNRDKFETTKDNVVKSVQQEPVSTFSIDVDTASYAFVRRSLEDGALPDSNSVRVEEMINYFSYDYPAADAAEMPFKPSVAVYPTPWNQNTMLMHIGIKGHQIVNDEKPRSNLVFLIDVSGSMQSRDKLPLLKSAFRLLVNRLDPQDTVSIVTYAGRAGTVLEPTSVKNKAKILAALDRLQSGGSTAGAQGIRQAYALAEQEFDKQGINRVILATDGDFNVGISDVDQLKTYIETKRKSGVFLSVLGFGQGNYNDHLMQVLAQNGNGNAAYIDSLREAQKVLVEEAGSTLFPIASDVKIQVEFNPAQIAEYRLIGYETRALKQEDFNNDKVDAGDIGSGHTVTAIYELTPVGSVEKFIDDLRYQKAETKPEETATEVSNEYAFLKMRYKLPGKKKSKLFTSPITPDMAHANVDALSEDMRFAASVAAFGQKLRSNPHLTEYSYDEILRIAAGARGADRFGYRSEFLALVRLAKSLDNDQR